MTAPRLPNPARVGILCRMPPVYLAVCRTCVGDPDPGCYRCQGDVVHPCDREEADLILTFTPLAVGFAETMTKTPKLERWLAEVE